MILSNRKMLAAGASPLSAKIILAGIALLGGSTVSSSAITVTASDFESPHVPANVLDGDLNTRWSANGDPQWIQFDLAAVKTVAAVDIAFAFGDQRGYNFDIETSLDGSNWSLAYMAQSGGQTIILERYDIVDVKARYVRIVGRGNTVNTWNNIAEVEIDAFTVSVTASSFQSPNVPANTLDGDLSTRWSADGLGEWIRYDFESFRSLASLQAAFFRGDERMTFFKIQASNDAANWAPLHSAVALGNTLDLESFSFPQTNTRYIRLVGQGNSWNNWNSFTEIDLSNPIPTWFRLFQEGDSSSDVASFDDVAASPDGDITVIGDFFDDTAIVARYDAFGAEQYVFNNNASSYAGDVSTPRHITADAGGNTVIVRRQNLTSTSPFVYDIDVLLTKLNSAGTIVWDTVLGSSQAADDTALDIEAIPNNGGYVVAGGSGGTVDGEWDAWLTKLDNAGNTVWSKTYTDSSLIGPGETFLEGLIHDVVLTEQNDFLLIGDFISLRSGTTRVAYQRALRVNSSGNVVWQTLINTYSETPNMGYFDTPLNIYRAVQLLDGSGSFGVAEADSSTEFRVGLLSSAGVFGGWDVGTNFGTFPRNGNSLVADSDGGFSVLTNEPSPFKDNFGVSKFEPNAKTNWIRSAYSNLTLSDERAYSIARTSDGGYCIVGEGGFPSSPMILKVDVGGQVDLSFAAARRARTYQAEDLSRSSAGATTSLNNAGNGVNLNANSTNDWIEFTIPVVLNGTYDVVVHINKFANAGKAQASVEGSNLGGEIDFYNGSSTPRRVVIGSVYFPGSGDKVIRFTVTGKNASASGFKLGFDSINLVRE